MNGYSKMRMSSDFTKKSRSIDFSDLTFSPEPKEAQEQPYPTSNAQQREAGAKIHDHFTCPEGEEGQQRSGLIVSRSCSSASERFRGNGTATNLQAMVRKAFSMRKPSSVAGGYWRIHDTGDGDGDGEFVEELHLSSSRKKKGKILRACKKIFGF